MSTRECVLHSSTLPFFFRFKPRNGPSKAGHLYQGYTVFTRGLLYFKSTFFVEHHFCVARKREANKRKSSYQRETYFCEKKNERGGDGGGADKEEVLSLC